MIEKYEDISKKLFDLGDLIQSWSQYKTLINISYLKLKYGTSIPSSKRENGKYKLYSSNGYTDNVHVGNNDGNIVMFGCRGTVGTTFYSKEPCFVLNTTMFFEVPKYLLGNYYFAVRQQNGFISFATGAAQPQITIENLKHCQLEINFDPVLSILIDEIDCIDLKIIYLKKLKMKLLSKYFD